MIRGDQAFHVLQRCRLGQGFLVLRLLSWEEGLDCMGLCIFCMGRLRPDAVCGMVRVRAIAETSEMGD